MNEKKSKDSSFSGQLGFVLAAAASAVGVGNLWRFPYFAAKDGGGIFLLTYLILLLTFGYALLSSDLAIGRRTQLSSIKAYGAMKPGWKFLGILTFFVPAIIMTYYAVIGGWITKYAVTFLTGGGAAAAQDDYFVGFIAFVVYRGVERGIEASSRIIMPILLVTVILISLYVLTLEVHDADGTVRTGLQGLAIYFLPNFEGLTLSKYIQIVLDAMSQMFYSLSVAMGIMITYGSYVKKDVNLNQSVSQIAIVDTAVAVLAGMARYCDFSTPFTSWMSRKSFGLYVFHYLGISMVALYIARPGLLPWPVCYLLSLAAGFAFGYGLYEIISRIPFFRWAVLGIKKEKK